MVKPMKLMVEVEEIAYGRIFRMLDGSDGVVSILPVGEGPRSQRATGGNVQKKGGAQSAPCIVLGALIAAGRVQLDRAALRATLKVNGKSETSLPDTLTKLKKAGEIRASGSGRDVVYAITAAGRKRHETACNIQAATE